MNGVLEIRFDIYDYVINLSPIAFNFCFKLMFLSMSNIYVSIGFKKWFVELGNISNRLYLALNL